MKVMLKTLSLMLALLTTGSLFAQLPENTNTGGQTDKTKTESSEPDNGKKPLDGIVARKTILEKRLLPYDVVRESDVFWERKVWRIIDVREKMNHDFLYPNHEFVKILLDASQKGEITVYSEENDRFEKALLASEVASKVVDIDTTETFDPETYERKIKVTRNDLNPEDIKQFRVKEVWFFDTESSSMKVRILGIAPLRDVYDKNTGNYMFTQPLFWVYYPDCRELLSRYQVFNLGGNDASPMSWEDLFEMRLFSSYVIKESNVYDRQIKDYLTGVDQLMEGEKIKQEIFNWEQDLWQY